MTDTMTRWMNFFLIIPVIGVSTERTRIVECETLNVLILNELRWISLLGRLIFLNTELKGGG